MNMSSQVAYIVLVDHPVIKMPPAHEDDAHFYLLPKLPYVIHVPRGIYHVIRHPVAASRRAFGRGGKVETAHSCHGA